MKTSKRFLHKSFRPDLSFNNAHLFYGLVVFLLGGGLALFLLTGEKNLAAVSDLIPVTYNALATAALFYASRVAARQSRTDAKAWLLIAVSQAIYLAADLGWAFFELVLKQEPYPSIVDIAYLLVYPVFLWGVFSFPYEFNTVREKRKFLLETLIIVGTAWLYLDNFIIEPILARAGETDFITNLFSVAYPLMDLVMLVALFYLVYHRLQAMHPSVMMFLILSIAITLVADIAFSITNLEGTYLTERLLDYLYPISYLATGLAAVLSTRPYTPLPRPSLLFQISLHRHISAVMLVAAFLLVVLGHYQQLALSYVEVIVGAGGVVVLSVLLQLIDAGDIDLLNYELRKLNIDLEQRVEQRTAELAQANLDLHQEMESRLKVAAELAMSEMLYRAVVEDLPVFICRFKRDGTLTFVNHAYCQYFNIPIEELIDSSFFMLIPESDRDFVRMHFQSLNAANPMVTYEHRVIASDGEIRWQRWIDRVIFTEGNEIEYQSIGEDITSQRRAQQAIRESEERFRDLFDNSTNLIQIISPDWKFIYVNKAWKLQLGYSERDLEWLTAWDVLQPETVEIVRGVFERALSGETIPKQDVVFLARDGRLVYTEGNITCKISDGKIDYIRAIFHDVTERRKYEEHLLHSAYYDSLTGLPNRAYLFNRLNQVLLQATKNDDFHYGLLYLDIDNFKMVNDTLGHITGDKLLVEIGQRLRQALRKEDVVARLGGDEFVILVENVGGEHFVYDLAERIVQELRQPFTIDGQGFSTGASIGVIYDNLEGDAQSILRDADIAMYRAKVTGKNNFVIFENRLREATIASVRLKNDLRQAVEEGQFYLEYQPIFELKTLALQGVEALLRWQHPVQGLVLPYRFIPPAEETGLIIPIGEWVLREACTRMAEWHRQFPSLRQVKISVNLSARQLVYSGLAAYVEKVLQETGLDPTCLALEITESTIMENIEMASEILNRLCALGIQIHMDDFGIGHSSLNRMQSLPIRTLKIDRSFLNASQRNGNLGIIRAIAHMCKELNIATIVEGVETQQQYTLLQELECDAGQGYLFSRPISTHDIRKLLAQQSKALPQPDADLALSDGRTPGKHMRQPG